MIACEIDGILCQPKPEKVRDNTCKYEVWVQNAIPLVTKTHVHHIITGRIRRFKKHTEEWLSKHEITYDKLDMWCGEPHMRWYMDSLAKWKAERYASSEAFVFQEHDKSQADIIRELSGKRVDLI